MKHPGQYSGYTYHVPDDDGAPWSALIVWLRAQYRIEVREPFSDPNRGVYAVAAVGSGALKIGIASDLPRRLDGLQVGCPHELRLVAFAAVPQAQSFEKHMHQRLADYRVRGEWFQDVIDVRRYVEAVVRQFGGIWVLGSDGGQ